MGEGVGEALCKWLRPDSNAVHRPQDGSASPQEGEKGRNNIPQAAKLKITLLWQIPSLTVLPPPKAALCFPLLEGQLCSSPVARSSLSFEKGFQLRAQNSTSLLLTLASSASCLLTHGATSFLVFLLPAPSVGCSIINISLSHTSFWPIKCSGAMNK